MSDALQDHRQVPTDLVDRMRERCGLKRDFRGVHPDHKDRSKMGARGTGRTTLMLLCALVAYEEGRSVAIIGQARYLRDCINDLMKASLVAMRTPYTMRFIEADHRLRDSIRNIPTGAAIFVDHWAAHQMVEASLGHRSVMESPT